MKHLKLFEDYIPDAPTPSIARYDAQGTIIKPENLDNYGIPPQIKEMMKAWPVIFKSPYGDSFYSSTDIGWGSKPDKSYRVSDHWNFMTRGNKHCQTDKPVPNNSHISIAQYSKSTGKYSVILSEPTTEHTQKLSKKAIKLKHLLDPETLRKKKEFKDRIANREVLIKLTYDGKDYEGVVRKMTTSEMKIVDENGEPIFSENYMEDRKITRLELTDRLGNTVENEMEIGLRQKR